jgi:hypothetical protein
MTRPKNLNVLIFQNLLHTLEHNGAGVVLATRVREEPVRISTGLPNSLRKASLQSQQGAKLLFLEVNHWQSIASYTYRDKHFSITFDFITSVHETV